MIKSIFDKIARQFIKNYDIKKMIGGGVHDR